jgi:hypothetical protein
MSLTVGNKVNTALSVTGDSYTGTDTTTVDTNNSRAYSALDYSQGKIGSSVNFGEGQGAVVNVLDAGAFHDATQLAQYGIAASSKTAQEQTDSALAVTQRAIDLAGMAQQGSGGTIINGLIWLFAIVGGVAGIYFYTKSEKKAAHG